MTAAHPDLSVVVPAYNEEAFIGQLLPQILALDLSAMNLTMEIIVVDDGSTDSTAAIVQAIDGVRLEKQPENRGKGAAVRAGIAVATGRLIMIQDADLEYDPSDYLPMLRRLLQGDVDAVYGSRYLAAGRHPAQSIAAYAGGRALSLAAWIATRCWLTDTVTALKLFTREAIADFDLVTRGFELDHELTCKLLARQRQIVEVPISYRPRSREEGKKIGFRDFLIALRTYRRFRGG